MNRTAAAENLIELAFGAIEEFRKTFRTENFKKKNKMQSVFLKSPRRLRVRLY